MRDDFITLGDFLDFLEWRKKQRDQAPQAQTTLLIPFVTPLAPRYPGDPPALRLYRESGRLYLVYKKGNIVHRLDQTRKSLRKISNRCFGPKKNVGLTLLGMSSYPVPVVTIGAMQSRIEVPDGKLVSVFDNGYISVSTASREGNTVTV